jgi:hypothetical protein
MARETEHGRGVPGIFFKLDVEPMALKIEERTMGFIDFAIRLAGIVGGILVCSGYAWRGEIAACSVTNFKLIQTRSLFFSCLCPVVSQSGMQRQEQPSDN